MKKQFLIVGAIAVAAVLGFYALKGTRVPPDGTQGAIGAAQKYQSEQIANADVSLDNPEIAAFLQTDTFHKIATDEAFRKAVGTEAFRRAISDQSFATIVGDAGRAKTVSENAKLFGSENLTGLAAELSRVAGTPGFTEAMNVTEFQKLAATTGGSKAMLELSHALEPAKAAALASSTEFHQWAEAMRKAGGGQLELAKGRVPESLASKAEFKQLMASESFTSSLQSPEFLAGLASTELAKALGNPRVAEMLSSTEAAKVFTSPAMTEMMSNAELMKRLADPAVGKVLAMGEAAKAFANPAVAEALAIPGVADLLTNPAMTEALQHTEFLAAAASPDFNKVVESAYGEAEAMRKKGATP